MKRVERREMREERTEERREKREERGERKKERRDKREERREKREERTERNMMCGFLHILCVFSQAPNVTAKTMKMRIFRGLGEYAILLLTYY